MLREEQYLWRVVKVFVLLCSAKRGAQLCCETYFFFPIVF